MDCNREDYMKECQSCRHWAGDERSSMAACTNLNSVSGSRMPHTGSCAEWSGSQEGNATFTFTVVNSTVKLIRLVLLIPYRH